jgi:hypothetical protein
VWATTKAPVERTNGVEEPLFDAEPDSVDIAIVDVPLAPDVPFPTVDALTRSIPSLGGDCPARAINSCDDPVGSAIRGGKADRLPPSARSEADTDSAGFVVPSFERVALGIVPGVASI